MNLFKSKKFKIAAAPPTIRVEKVPDAQKSALSKPASLRKKQVQRSEPFPSGRSSSAARSTRPPKDCGSSRLKTGKRKVSRQTSPAQPHFDPDTDDDGTTEEREGTPIKRQRTDRPTDVKRQLRLKEAFSEADGDFQMIHAADISPEKKKSRLADTIPDEHVVVELKYPSSSQLERYNLVFGAHNIDAPKEIIAIANIVADAYLTENQKIPFHDPDSGVIRKLQKAANLLGHDQKNKDLLEGFKNAVENYNSTIDGLLKDGALQSNLDARHHLPSDMIEIILKQVYERAVSPKVDLLKHYENGTDNVYGELKSRFISDALGLAGLRSEHVFVDLGSGVGNVVLQAALEFGCESWGCEMMVNACELADAQEKEFAARCRLWGIKPGEVRLERGDFLDNQKILKTIKRADVILVNNQAFTEKLNRSLTDLFLDLKDGCKIVSLKKFGKEDHEITSRKQFDPANLLVVDRHEWYQGYVSWTDAVGTYYIATKDDSRLQNFAGL